VECWGGTRFGVGGGMGWVNVSKRGKALFWEFFFGLGGMALLMIPPWFWRWGSRTKDIGLARGLIPSLKEHGIRNSFESLGTAPKQRKGNG